MTGLVVASFAAITPTVAQSQINTPTRTQGEVNGYNVKEVSYYGGIFRQLSDGSWIERNKDGRFRFTEINRDEWSVYLRKTDGNSVQLDLYHDYVKTGGVKKYGIIESKSEICTLSHRWRKYQPGVRHTMTLRFDPQQSDAERIFHFKPVTFNLNRDLPIYLLFHGFNSNPDRAFGPGPILETLLGEGKSANVIAIDWSDLIRDEAGGENIGRYGYVASRTWNVGWALAQALQEELCLDTDNIKIVAHSLGAHVAASFAHRWKRNTGKTIKSIVALDPAGQFMSSFGSDVRLTSDDANRVIAIHGSDARHFLSCPPHHVGWYDPLADLDVYVFTAKHKTSTRRPCARGGERCSFSGTRRVTLEFGSLLPHTFIKPAETTATDGITCSPGSFGANEPLAYPIGCRVEDDTYAPILLGSGPGCEQANHEYVWDIYGALLTKATYTYAKGRTNNKAAMTIPGFDRAALEGTATNAPSGMITINDGQ